MSFADELFIAFLLLVLILRDVWEHRPEKSHDD